MASKNFLTAKEGFNLLLLICKSLKIRVIFGFPKSVGKVSGGALYYNSRTKRGRIYLPKSFKKYYSIKKNSVLLHEIGHYFVIKADATKGGDRKDFCHLLNVYEECMAWIAAIKLARLLSIRVDKNFKMVMRKGLDSYIDVAYSDLDHYIIKFLILVQETLKEDT